MTDLIFHDDVFVRYLNHMGSDDEIIDAARTSTKPTFGNSAQRARDDFANSRNEKMDWKAPTELVKSWMDEAIAKDRGLINMLVRDRHGSPFEHAVLKVHVKAPIFVFREWHRHRIASYNEQSGRYMQMLPEFYVPADSRPMTQVGKPGAYTFEPGTPEQVALAQHEARTQAQAAWESYVRQLEFGIAKELAREVLPVNIYSQMHCTMNIRALTNFLSLRTKQKENSKVPSFPQHEISLGADKLEAIFAERFPWTYEAWQNNGRVAL